MSDIKLEELLKKAKANTISGSKNYYKPLPPDESEMIREYFRSKIDIPLDGDDNMEFFNKEGTKIAKGYVRVVVGDYGPYVEFDRSNMVLDNIEEKWPGSEKKTIKYIWLETKDKAKTKIHWQRKKVPYADYQVGMYYIHPSHLIIED